MSLLHARRLDRAFAFGRIHTDVMVTMMMMVIMMMMMMMMVMMMVTMTMTTVAVAVCGCGPSPQVGRGGGVALGTAAYDPRKKAWERWGTCHTHSCGCPHARTYNSQDNESSSSAAAAAAAAAAAPMVIGGAASHVPVSCSVESQASRMLNRGWCGTADIHPPRTPHAAHQ
jgi:hypothetical protein